MGGGGSLVSYARGAAVSTHDLERNGERYREKGGVTVGVGLMTSTFSRAFLAGDDDAEFDAAGAPDGDSEGEGKEAGDSQSGGTGAFLSGDVVLMRMP